MVQLSRPLLGVVLTGQLVLSTGATAVDPENPGSDLKPCPSRCFAQALSVNQCAASDTHCLCTSRKYINTLSACIVENCTMEDAYVVSHASGKLCNAPRDNHQASLRAAVFGSIIACYLIVALRVAARVCTTQRFWWDDWSHVIAAALTTPLAVFAVLCTENGMGYHIYDLSFSSTSKLQDLLIWYYICQIFWAVVMYAVKMSILFLYIRIFPSRLFKLYVIVTMVLVTISILILVPMVIFQCNPVSATWNLYRKDAFCLGVSAVAYANAAVNIGTEVAILVLPLPLLSKLRVSWRTKLGLYMLFGCGILVIGIASARIPSLKHVEAINDPTYDNNGVFYWTCAETAVAHVCSAAPAIRPLYLKIKQACRRRTEDNTDNFHFSSGFKSRTGSEEPINGNHAHSRPDAITTHSLALSGTSSWR